MTDRLSPEREAEIAAAVAELDADRTLSFGTWTASPVTEKSTLPPEQAFAVEDVARMGGATLRGSVGVFGNERHAAFTALARTAVPDLLAELAAVRAERDEARARVAAVDGLSLPEKLKVDTIAPEYRNGYVHALADMREAWIALAMEVSNPQCTAEYGGPGHTHCELPAGHEGQHASAIGNMRRATWGGGR